MTPTYSVEEFNKRVKFYFKDMEETRNEFPDEGGMINYIFADCPPEIDEEEEYKALKTMPEYDKIIRWARRRRMSWLERNMVKNPRAATGCMNALKQEKNGGYSDKPAEKKEKQLNVRLEMMTGDEK